MRKGTKARIARQKRALERLIIRKEPGFYPFGPFADEDAYAAYYARKIHEKSALQVRTKNAA